MSLFSCLQIRGNGKSTWGKTPDGKQEMILALYLGDPGISSREAKFYYGRIVLEAETFEAYKIGDPKANKAFFFELYSVMNELFGLVMKDRAGKETVGFVDNTIIDLGVI